MLLSGWVGEARVAGPRGARDGERVWVSGSAARGKGMGGDCAVGCLVSVYVSARSGARA